VEVEMTPKRTAGQFDVAVIGGGAAGLSAAVALGRARRAVIVLDDTQPVPQEPVSTNTFVKV
jgi:thioredoxin reductase